MAERRTRVLALCAFPREAAATRFRLEQYREPLATRGIDLTISSFLSSEQFSVLYKSGGFSKKVIGLAGPVLLRALQAIRASKFDVVLVQREAMIIGPGIVEWLIKNISRRPLILDLDDATYVRYQSPTYGRIGSALKFFGKTDKLISRSAVVICGNRFIADHVRKIGSRSVVIPTVVDLNVFKPLEVIANRSRPIVGWIGTHSTFPFLRSLFPVLERLAADHKFTLRVIGAGEENVRAGRVEVENLEWSLEREHTDFASMDIGLYPITPSSSANEDWLKGKSGFKAIQYMACGVPFVMTPVGVAAAMGEIGRTHFNADNEEDWYNSLNRLLSDRNLRLRMGAAGRDYAIANYGLEEQADLLAETLKQVCNDQGNAI